MRRAAPTLSLLICLLACAQTAAAKDTWTSVRSKNFFLVGNAGEKEIRQVATRLEQFRDVFTRLFAGANFSSPVPTTVVVFKDDGAYKPFKPLVDGKPSDVAGYFQPGEDVNYITLTPKGGGGEEPLRTVYHEYVHLLVENTLGRGGAPPWFNEGLAEYYSTFEIDDGRKVYLGRLIENHIYLLRQARLVPLKTLFEIDSHSLHRNGRESKGVFYAQSWALVHYLILGNEGRRLPQVNRFLTLLSQKRPTEEAFREAFQTDFASMEKELKNYIEGRSFRAQVATFERKLEFDTEMQAAALAEAEAEAYLGDLLLHTNRPEEAVRRLEAALKLDPKQATAHASLGMAYMRLGRHEDARRHLREAVAADSRNYLAHYYYAYARSREASDANGLALGFAPEAAREMRDALRRAIELKPDFPESYHLLAFVNLVTGENLEESVRLLARARQLSPGNARYDLVLAQVYLRQEKFEEARRAVEPLTRETSDPQMRADARAIFESISSYERHVANLKAARAAADENNARAGETPRLVRRGEETAAPAGPPPPPGKSEEELMAEALAEAINAALRKPLEGEARAEGVLTRIECTAKGVVLVVKVGDRLLRVASQNFEALHIMAFTREAGSELSCGPRKVESRVLITYRPAPDARAKTDGVAAALEFVPANFRLK